ncbi:iron uptake transporter permease EfeU [Micropruina sp.]|uniref:iron uptake transporter permease EfeU n=1 Tax=Micropruina sp. TaxID=2737536 RepID=UPI00262A1786|nr:iron uptake transporter permease EfeU [Micropruina sp.]
MLATFIIGLREGLEAALIVGIIAAFLRRNGRSLTPMMIGVGAAILLSLGVGVGLRMVETSLPQAAQEGMEAVIGVIAIVFVTGMLLWMNSNAGGLKRHLESSATEALGAGTGRALVVMAFLAVLKEGFETSVFLLATFSASTNAGLAATGAILGILTAAVIGYGLYTGGMRLNLGRFFRFTSIFLLLVAAGLVVSTLGKMHGAGWIDAGQAPTVDLSWLAPPGSVQGALFTGVLGIPPDPRVIQVVGWFGYVIPMAIYVYWPKKWRPDAFGAVRLRFGIAGALAVAAVALFLAIGPAQIPSLGAATLVDSSGQTAGSVRVEGDRVTVTVGASESTMPLTDGVAGPHRTVPDAVAYRQAMDPTGVGALPSTLTLDDLAALNGGRLPLGINPVVAKGPFNVNWAHGGERQLWLVAGEVLDFTQTDTTTATLSGGGLANPRTLTLSGTLPNGTQLGSGSLSVDAARVQVAEQAALTLRTQGVERTFWGRVFPALLLLAALITVILAERSRRRLPQPDHAVAASESESRRNLNVS